MKDPMIGQQLANFRVECLLGQGGMATVYYGTDVKLKRPVAIKVIDRRYRDNPAYVTRFINEARMMAQWRHENIIQIYYADEKQGHSYYVMEYVDGDDLATVMAAYAEEDAQMPNEDVLRIGYAVANALDYAHSRGVIHRDVKPSNILIAKDGRVLLGDFGMALEVSDGSMGNVFGTPHYISPEQAKRSADAVPQSDLYSLGVILYEALTGSVPFDDPSPASVALMHISQSPPSLRSLNPGIGPAVEAVILRALEKRPKNRYQSGAELMSALEDAFEASAPLPKLSLPPLPVGVPTIRQDRVSIEQMTRHMQVPKNKKGDAVKAVKQPVAAWQPEKRSNAKKWWIFLLLLLLFGLGGWYFTRGGLFSTGSVPALILTSSPFDLAQSWTNTPEPVLPTQTLPQSSATMPATSTTAPTATATLTATPIPTSTSTVLPTATFTQSMPSLSPEPVVGLPSVQTPNGNNLTLFWNETSFVMLNRTRVQRSLSGFTFERLDASGQPTDTFPGYKWETRRFKYIPYKVCVGIRIYAHENPPYLDPADCNLNYLSIVQPEMEVEPTLFFWNSKEGSTQFRVLWLSEEVAHCEISA
ncbi:partial Serine/threonine-protein kinase StkP, partial [Anaerolineales bacterium]